MVICCLFISTAISANEPVNAKKTVKSEIVKLMKAPELELGTNEVVKLKFLINDDNEIIVVSVNSDTRYLESIVRSTLNRKTISVDEIKYNTIYTLPIRFRSKA